MPTIVWADTTAMILLTYLFPLLIREWVDTSNEDLMGLDEARMQCGRQGVKQLEAGRIIELGTL